MQTLSTIVVTETTPATEPVSLQELKDWLEIDYADKDSLLTGMLKGARQTVERLLNLALVENTVTFDVDTTCAEIIALPYAKGVSEVVVKSLDDNDAEETKENGTDYFVRGTALRIPVYGRYTVSYTTVPGDIPEDIKEAIKEMVLFDIRGEGGKELSNIALQKLQPHVVQWL